MNKGTYSQGPGGLAAKRLPDPPKSV